MTEAKNNTLLDLESMANETLDTIPDAPDFVQPPAGEYSITCKDACIDKGKNKEGEDYQRLKITYFINETKSTLNNEPPVPNDSIFTETFQGTEQGLSFFKKRIKEIMGVTDVAGVTLGDMMSSARGASFNARISYKTAAGTGKNAGKTYTNLQMRIIPAA